MDFTLDDSDLRINGIQALFKALGPTNALRFLSLISHERTDYVQMSRKLYEGQTVDEIFERSKDLWEASEAETP